MAEFDPTLADGLALLGAGVAAAGTYVPWVVTPADAEVVPAVYLAGMEWGFSAPDYAVLALVAVGLAAAGAFRADRRGGPLAAATGVGVLVVVVAHLVSVLARFAVFDPGPGAYATAAGGLLLVAAGWRHYGTVGGDAAGVQPA